MIVLATTAVLAVTTSPQAPLQAQWFGPCCQMAPVCPSPPVECTVWVPKVVTERCLQTVTRYRRENRERTVVTYRDVPFTKTVEEPYTVMIPQTRTRTVSEIVNHPVYRDIELRKTAMTPRIETRQATRPVCRVVPVQEERTVCEVPDPCASQAPAVLGTVTQTGAIPVRNAALVRTVAERPAVERADPNAPPPPVPEAPPVSPPKSGPANTLPPPGCASPCVTCAPVIQRKVKVTCWKPVYEQETIQYPVTHLQPNARLETVSFYEFRPETVTRQEHYVVQVPEARVRTREVTATRTVPEERREPYSVLVPYHEKVWVSVPRVEYVPETVVAPAF
jgi:hypothetical protein